MRSKTSLPGRKLPAAHCLVEVRSSPVHGRGVFAKVDIPSGRLIACYEGKRYAPDRERPAWNGASTYLFLLSDGSIIDGSKGGNASRYINHSCSPNVEAIEDIDGGLPTVNILAKQEIRAGNELFLDYALDLAGEAPSDHACRCGDVRCRGSMAAVPLDSVDSQPA